MNFTNWESKELPLSELKLDHDNPRVFVDNPTQESLRNYLIEFFDVFELAKSINQNKGLYPTEKIIVVEEGNDYIVVEGNRRTAACQIINNPTLLSNYNSMNLSQNSETQKNIQNIEVVIAPSRDEAEPFITSKHTTRGYKPWSRLSQVRRVLVRYNRGQSITQISRILNQSEHMVRKSLNFHSFIQYVWTEIDWNEEERGVINNPLMEATKIDRFLPFSDKAKEVLGIYFARYQFKFTEPKEYVDKVLKDIFRRVFIEESINTRSSMEEVFNNELIQLKNEYIGEKQVDKTQPEGTTDSVSPKVNPEVPQEPKTKHKGDTSGVKSQERTKTSPQSGDKGTKNATSSPSTNSNQNKLEKQKKPQERKYLYQGIVYNDQSSGISQTLYELGQINYKNLTLSATFLVRTLLECSLQQYLRTIGRENEAMNNGRDPSLTNLLNFYNQNNILKGTHNRFQGIISNFLSQKWADTLNSISHAKYSDPDPSILKTIESQTYSLVQWLLKECGGNDE
ncbi:ParB-like nuclease domain-containing protein [Halobacillus kuroshimensis]|uniref:ParB-like nuclease domain-containing protein n=1 Tax=Halobacillus kuroshimensis TaxID=302481 RepID=A0ABS3DZT3_9BACI|nr:ParB/RepB/Spo0J family partition protein [Halobacillus kuroshimensis]MBN8236863.1 ParB-like nuclease domain-containing protein [Halobacillus kuroshimensis]